MSKTPRQDATDLVHAAHERGTISDEARRALQASPVVKQIEAGLDGSQTVKKPGRITLATLQPDDSRSIFMDDAGVVRPSTAKSRVIIQGHNELLNGMLKGPEGRRAMLHTRYLNGKVVNPFLPLALCRAMSADIYKPDPRGTPLYKETLVTLGIVLAKVEELTQRGARVRSATLVMTDGEATDYSLAAKQRLSAVIRDMREGGAHIVAGMGLGDEEKFQETFRAMGIDHIYTAGNVAEILDVFRMFGDEIRLLGAGSSTTMVRRHGA